MDYIALLFTFVTQLGQLGSVVVVLALAFLYKDAVFFKLGFKRNYDDGKPVTTLQELAGKFSRLELYVNHEQSNLIQEVIDGNGKILSLLEKDRERDDKIEKILARQTWILEEIHKKV